MRIVFLLTQSASDWRAERLRSMHQHFKEPSGDVYLNISIAVLAILAIFVIMKLLDYVQKRRQSTNIKAQPMALYWRIQSKMGLSFLDRWQLWRLASSSAVPNPTALLISPVLFDRAVASYCGGLGNSSPPARLAAIRKRLFGRAEPSPVDPIAAGD
jgi:hypothetical protein